MVDGRDFLPIGTQLVLENGSIYQIIGQPIGRGGGSILYPAQRLIYHDNALQTDGFSYALKECYPVSGGHTFIRSQNGEIVAQGGSKESADYLIRAQSLQLNEGSVSQKIYQTASRMLPIRESSQAVSLTIPGKKTVTVFNTVTVMESLSEKGRSLTSWIKENRRFSPIEAFRIIQQLLFSLREVHQAGYLHLDIQDGNVFLKGTLEKKNELVTLIDFGSARHICNGKTAPIRDQVIFTTPGFSAPEIMLHNDGTLQLGAEADIYSVGCLALYLLTGRKADSKILLENRSGIYLKPNQLQRIKCPKHLVDRMQQILAKALEKEPVNRYHSADGMLEDVTELVDALRPYRTDLSAVKYDAFICYKHGPIDSDAALALQRALENYHAPKGVAQSRKPFKRVFVDEGELSSCADFGQQIREVLKNAGWLIVVCSEDTPASPWVQLEIDTFLETHSRSRLLCVLTGGDEKVSFPPALKGSGNGEGEVLAADARGADIHEVIKKLRTDALLKLAAPMLGTTFDSLKQRQKLYQVQRVAAVTAVLMLAAAGFAAYATNRANVIAEQAVRIELEYQNALINESLFLSAQAEKLLSDNDPLGAIELALQALPSQTQDRPILTESEYVLGRALGIYKTPDSAQNTVTATGVIDTKYSEFFLDEKGDYLISWDPGKDSIQVLDAATLSVIRNIVLETNPNQLSSDYLLQNNLIIPMDNQVVCLDYVTGETTWTASIDNLIAVCVSSDKSKIVTFSGDSGTSFGSTTDTSLALTINILSADTGKPFEQFTCPINGNPSIKDSITLSPDMKWAAIPTYSLGKNALYLLNMEDGTFRNLIDAEMSIASVQFIDDRVSIIRTSGNTTIIKWGNDCVHYADPGDVWLESYALESGELIWRSEHQCYSIFDSEGLARSTKVQYTESESERDYILYTFSNQCVLLDWETGQVVRTFDLSSSVADIFYRDDGFVTINSDGSHNNVNYQTGRIIKRNLFNDVVTSVFRNGTTFYVQDCLMFEQDYRIRKYELDKYDSSYIQLFHTDSHEWEIYSFESIFKGTRFVLTRDNQVCFVDTAKNESHIYEIPPEYGFADHQILGTSSDCSRIYWQCRSWEDDRLWVGRNKYYCMDLLTGNIAQLQHPNKPAALILVEDIVFCDEKLFFAAKEQQDTSKYLAIYCWDFVENSLTEKYRSTLSLEFETTQEEVVYRSEEYISSSLAVNEESHQLQFAVGLSIHYYDDSGNIVASVIERPQQLIDIDLENERIVSTAIEFELETKPEESFLWQKEFYHWSSSGTLAVFGYGDWIYALDGNGKQIWRIPILEPLAGIYLSLDESILLMLSDKGILSSYDVSNGTILDSIDLEHYSDDSGSTVVSGVSWEFIDGKTLAVYTIGKSFLIDSSDNNLRMKAIIEQGIGYDSVNDGFFVSSSNYSSDNTVIGYFHRYSVDELIQMAQNIVS